MGKNFSEGPALQLGKRLGLNDADTVTDLGLALFVVDVVFLRPLDNLVELRMGNAGDVLDDDGLLHFVGDDDADASLAKVRLGFLSGIAHGSVGLRRWG